MSNQSERKRQVVRYLMAEMKEDERSAFEGGFFSDSDLFEELIAAEDRMMRAYVQEDCTESERAAFARRFLATAEGRERVELSRSLMECVDSMYRSPTGQGAIRYGAGAPMESSFADQEAWKPCKHRWFTTLARAVMLWDQLSRADISIAIAKLMGAQPAIPGFSPLEQDAEADPDALTEHSGEGQERKPYRQQWLGALAGESEFFRGAAGLMGPIKVMAAAFGRRFLEVRLVRIDPVRPVVIHDGFRAVFLRPVLGSNRYASYMVSVRTVQGELVWRQAGLRSRPNRSGSHRLDFIVIPAEVLESRSHILKISGRKADGTLEEVAIYRFRVVRPHEIEGSVKVSKAHGSIKSFAMKILGKWTQLASKSLD